MGTVTITDPTDTSEGGGQLPIISTVFSMSTVGGTEDPEEGQATEVEHVSTVMPTYDIYDPKEKLGSHDLRIKKELVEENLQPGDPGFYANLQYVYQNLQGAEKAVEASKNTPSHSENIRRYNSISQILENMKTAYHYHAKWVGKVLPKGWDMVELGKPIPSKGAKGMGIIVEDNPD